MVSMDRADWIVPVESKERRNILVEVAEPDNVSLERKRLSRNIPASINKESWTTATSKMFECVGGGKTRLHNTLVTDVVSKAASMATPVVALCGMFWPRKVDPVE